MGGRPPAPRVEYIPAPPPPVTVATPTQSLRTQVELTKISGEQNRLNMETGAELDRIKELALKKGSFSSAVNAETNRGKAAGLYIDRKIIKTGKLEDLSEQELENKMKQILEDYAPLLNAKTVEGESEVISSESSLPTDEESLSDPQS